MVSAAHIRTEEIIHGAGYVAITDSAVFFLPIFWSLPTAS